MKKFLYILAALSTAFAVSSCKQTEPEPEPQNPSQTEELADAYPRKLLLEHFTGQSCGYCPMGISYINTFVAAQGADKVVWLSNHSGYADDMYTIKESKQLATKFKVQGAPNVMLNREKTKYYDEESGRNVQNTVFHPYYLTTLSSLTMTAPASVNIKSTYEPSNRYLDVTVNGSTAPDVEGLSVVVVVKESGLHGIQSDYYDTWEGWDDFVHNNAVRRFLTSYLGDELTLTDRRYSFTIDAYLKEAWNADNCSVVAFLVDADGVVVNAEQVPVIEGTAGGADIKGGGVTPTPVPDTYPEYEAVPEAATDLTLDSLIFFYNEQLAGGYSYMLIMFPKTTRVDGKVPLYYTQLVLPSRVTSFADVPDGTYPLLTSGEAGTALAGVRDDSRHEIGGSQFFLANADYFKQGYLVGDQWLLTSGSITLNKGKVTVAATTLSGSEMSAVYRTGLRKTPAEQPAIKAKRSYLGTCTSQIH